MIDIPLFPGIYQHIVLNEPFRYGGSGFTGGWIEARMPTPWKEDTCSPELMELVKKLHPVNPYGRVWLLYTKELSWNPAQHQLLGYGSVKKGRRKK